MNKQIIDATVSTSDSDTTGYQMKFWGDLDLTWAQANGVIASDATTTIETDALWMTYDTSKQLKVSDGDASKTIYMKIRDDVHNESDQASDSINLDTSLPTVTITGPDVSTISEQPGKNVAAFSFQVDVDFSEYVVKVVNSTGADHTTGAEIGTIYGSTNMSGTGTFVSGNVINAQIMGHDLEIASPSDGSKIVKVFARESTTGNWSV